MVFAMLMRRALGREEMNSITPFNQVERFAIKQAHICFGKLPYPKSCEFADLKQEAVITYYKAVDRFDPTRNFAFSTFYGSILKRRFGDIVSKAYKDRRVRYNTQATVGRTIKSTADEVRMTFLDELSPTAKLVARCCLNPPEKLRSYVKETSSNRRWINVVMDWLDVVQKERSKITNEIRLSI